MITVIFSGQSSQMHASRPHARERIARDRCWIRLLAAEARVTPTFMMTSKRGGGVGPFSRTAVAAMWSVAAATVVIGLTAGRVGAVCAEDVRGCANSSLVRFVHPRWRRAGR
jgi:hypothetical protein